MHSYQSKKAAIPAGKTASTRREALTSLTRSQGKIEWSSGLLSGWLIFLGPDETLTLSGFITREFSWLGRLSGGAVRFVKPHQ